MTNHPSSKQPSIRECAPNRPLRLIRLPDVIARVGIKRSMIYRLMSEERFPRSRSLGPKCAVWVESEIDEWILQISDKQS